MTTRDIRTIALDILGGIAPEADLATLADDADLREALDLDSMDFLNFVSALHEATGVEIAEKDYRKLFTLAGVKDYFRLT